jgi:hypothetical protein
MYPEDIAREFDRSFEKAKKAAADRPWAHPAKLPEHPQTHSDRHPEDPESVEFKQYF